MGKYLLIYAEEWQEVEKELVDNRTRIWFLKYLDIIFQNYLIRNLSLIMTNILLEIKKCFNNHIF